MEEELNAERRARVLVMTVKYECAGKAVSYADDPVPGAIVDRDPGDEDGR